ncbi:DUF599 domain-containing protein [Ramlibacter sp. Leaf400]|uniref:DUF599 domain-containing protein n=1 Tax=Ramlibacter sp. Leaf400 TaxID=1736365 RepID=UPI0006F484B4|nr:DUF599 domain-containing protein [Ramlibacter sp. Leaf400]KQT10367.1 hypothetical protein ASG30_11020 [Ramlibacter sp. Leaf400]
MNLLAILSLADWLAAIWFVAVWVAYAWFSRRASRSGSTLLATTNRWRTRWMLQATSRDPRVLDGIIIQSLSSSPSFFASATLIIIGGLLALLGTTDKAAEFVREIPFAARTTMLVFEIKVLSVMAIFVFAFFRFTWSMRQYTFAALVLGSMPEPRAFTEGHADREHVATRAGKLVGMAAETFNDGIRAYYFSFAALAWFFSPLAFAIAAAVVAGVLYAREFNSHVLHVLRD